jgi:hypothetical protein
MGGRGHAHGRAYDRVINGQLEVKVDVADVQVPGWPELAPATVSAASTRMVLIASSSFCDFWKGMSRVKVVVVVVRFRAPSVEGWE